MQVIHYKKIETINNLKMDPNQKDQENQQIQSNPNDKIQPKPAQNYIDSDDDGDIDIDADPDHESNDDADEQQVDLMDDVASSDSQLQVHDPSQQMNQGDIQAQDGKTNDPMTLYLKKQQQILTWLDNHPGQKWIDQQFPCNTSQFYQDASNIPEWGVVLKNLEWKRPDQITKQPKFMIIEEDKQTKTIQIDAKHGIFAGSWFINALTIIGIRSPIIDKLIIQKQYFDRGFITFQFFKNGTWIQIIVDTLLPYQKQHNTRTCLYSSCANPNEFWIQLMEKAYVKLHRNYQRICQGSILEGLVDLTGGVSEWISLLAKDDQVLDPNTIWSILLNCYHQKFVLGCTNYVQGKDLKNAQQGQQGILQNHYYTIMDIRDFPKDNLKLLRLRNPWGNQGVWTGAFCQQADDWQKYKAIKQQLKNIPKTKKTDGSWWMSFSDFMVQFDRVSIAKIFPDNWQMYSIQGQWQGKTNGGKCPINILGEKSIVFDGKDIKQKKQFIQIESDDRWFNNPQYRIKIVKDTKIYISLMQEDQKITGLTYLPVSFMIATTKSKNQRIWERPLQSDIIAEVNANGQISNTRELTHYLTLRKHQGKQKLPKIYTIIPNILDTKQTIKKDQIRKFYLRLLSPQTLDVTQLPQTLETTVEGQWTQTTAGGSRKIQIKQDGMGKKKGEIKDNPSWCKNPQYFLTLTQPTMLKIILKKTGTKKFKGWKIGMTICRYSGCEEKPVEKSQKKDKSLGNIQRLLQQTSQFLEPPVLNQLERKLIIQPNENFKQSLYFSQDVSALFFKWNPTQGPFVIIPSSDGQQRYFGYKLTIFSNNPVNLFRLDDASNQVIIGKWQKDISAGGCHLNQLQKSASQRTWSTNPKYQLIFKDMDIYDESIKIKITLTVAQKNWKKLNPNTVNGMIGIYLLQRKQGKLTYNKNIVITQTNFLPVKQISLEITLGGQGQPPIKKDGYIIMPSTYQSKVQGSFIIAVKCDRSFQLAPFK